MGVSRAVATLLSLITLTLVSMLLWSRGFAWGVSGNSPFMAIVVNLAMFLAAVLAAIPIALEIAALYIVVTKRGLLREVFRGLRKKFHRGINWWATAISLLLLMAVIGYMRSGGSLGNPNRTRELLGNLSNPNVKPAVGININISGFSRTPFAPNFKLYGVLALILAVAIAAVIVRSVSWGEEVEVEEGRREIARAVDRAIREIELGGDPRSIIIRCYMEMCAILSRVARRPEPYETPREFQRAVLSRYPELPEGPIGSLTEVFEEAVYSNHELSRESVEKALGSLRALREFLKTYLGVEGD